MSLAIILSSLSISFTLPWISRRNILSADKLPSYLRSLESLFIVYNGVHGVRLCLFLLPDEIEVAAVVSLHKGLGSYEPQIGVKRLDVLEVDCAAVGVPYVLCDPEQEKR
jgi:hypothetical protein